MSNDFNMLALRRPLFESVGCGNSPRHPGTYFDPFSTPKAPKEPHKRGTPAP